MDKETERKREWRSKKEPNSDGESGGREEEAVI